MQLENYKIKVSDQLRAKDCQLSRSAMESNLVIFFKLSLTLIFEGSNSKFLVHN